MRLLIMLLLLAHVAFAESEPDLTKELQTLNAQLKAQGVKAQTAQKLKQAQDWRKGVLAFRSEARNLSPLVTQAVKTASFGFVELRASRGVGDKRVALRVLIGTNEREPLVTGQLPFLEPRQTEDGLWLSGLAPWAPGASLLPIPTTKLDRLRRQRDESKTILQLAQDPKLQQNLDKLRKDNAALAKKVGWKTLTPGPIDVDKALRKSLTPGLRLVKLTPGATETLELAHQLSWPGTHFDVELSGTPKELAQQLASWESFGLDRPVLLESVQMDLQKASVRFIAFARR